MYKKLLHSKWFYSQNFSNVSPHESRKEINRNFPFQGYSSDEGTSTVDKISDVESDIAEPTAWDVILQEAWAPEIEQTFYDKKA